MPSDTDARDRRRAAVRPLVRRIVWGGLLAVTTATALRSQMITRAEALAVAYPGAEIRTEQVFLRPEEQKQAAELAGVPIPSALVVRYLATQHSRIVGRAYIDTHVVRTKKETLLICLDAEGRVKRIEILAFLEPPEYTAPEAWRQQFTGRRLDDQTALHRAIRPIAGATLTARAVTEATRRVLALDRVLAARMERQP